MFKTGLVEEEIEILTQRSNSSLQESQAGCLNKKDKNAKNLFKKRQSSITEEVDTQDLPGSDFMIPRREDFGDNKENKNKKFYGGCEQGR
jgi:hypothetical protein